LKHARTLMWTVLVLLGLVAGFAAWASRPAIHPIEAPQAGTFDAALVAQGANLAAIGNCAACHTARGGGQFAGGRAMSTPFGVIYSTNITPDPISGIGHWSERAFVRAMQEGVDREGDHLYPAFPYDHFTKLTDEDARALYAYFMTREPVRATTPPNELPFPLNIRELLAAWKAIYFRAQRFEPNSGHDVVWNRGAYLAEGVAHCGACHTERNALGAEKKDRALAGGEVEGWNAYAIDRSSPAPVPWDVESLAFYLRHGWHSEHGISRGPMSDVTSSLAIARESDVRAIATYVVSRMSPPTPQPTPSARAPANETNQLGFAVYESTCAHCHSGARPLPYGGIDLSLSTAISAPNPRNIINVTLHGLHGPAGERAAIMPGFEGAISDAQLAALLGYMRHRFSDEPPWPDVGRDIDAAREVVYEEGDSWP
jgi:mono/diheme cytochrome c family protein